jgi:hypothetical protein
MGVFAMIDEEQAIRAYLELNPTQFDVMDKFELHQQYSLDQEHKLFLELWLRMYENEYDDARRLRLTFEGVRDLKTAFQGFTLLPKIVIRSIRDYQWEQLRYEVKDAEDNCVSFFCRSFQAEIIEMRWE